MNYGIYRRNPGESIFDAGQPLATFPDLPSAESFLHSSDLTGVQILGIQHGRPRLLSSDERVEREKRAKARFRKEARECPDCGSFYAARFESCPQCELKEAA